MRNTTSLRAGEAPTIRQRWVLASLLLFVPLAGPARPDRIVLKGGAVLEGRVLSEESESLLLETAFGRQKIDKARIVERIEAPWNIGILRDRVAGADGLEALREILQWTQSLPEEERRKLRGEMSRLHRKVLEYDPEDPEARQALGYEKVEGRWLRGGELARWRAGREAARAEEERRALERAEQARLDKAHADRFGGTLLSVQLQASEKQDAEAATALSKLLETPCISVTSKRVSVKGVLVRELAFDLVEKAELFLTAQLRVMGLPGGHPAFPLGSEGRFHFVVIPPKLMERAYDALVPHFIPGGLAPATRTLVLSNELDLFPLAEGALAIHRFGNGDIRDVFFHFLGHAFVCSLTRGFQPWLVEGFGLWMSEVNAGTMQMCCITISRYAEKRTARRVDREGHMALLLEAVQTRRDTPFESLLRKPLNSLTEVDLAKSWSLVSYAMAPRRAPATLHFLQGLARGDGEEAALQGAFGLTPAAFGEAWRKWLLEGEAPP